MMGEAIEFESGHHQVNTAAGVLDTSTKNGITCVWSGTVGNSCKINFTWEFNWDTLKSQGVNKITGYIYVSSFYNWFTATKIDVTLTENNHEITKQVQGQKYGDDVSFECSLTPHYEIPSYDDMFLPSDQNDTILVVDGKKLHVSKAVSSFYRKIILANRAGP
ncbi:hypothetical protein GCK72_004235 [Caenorhabditis remanei]|uniref:Uncharacterized protein n=1 Tax=Caenorhabditis remanei TaxID=31234 RepID=A0A6A5H978_CAERE|nr:hypothetical protein GCK72_004235 [Caenorhabditis remanei]KAF1764288.1 hypothetical protein GCK72_004235 [Caenorhabditis remanei]